MKKIVFKSLLFLLIPSFVLCGCHASTRGDRSGTLKSYSYDGPHPVYVADGLHHWCDISGPHSHYYRPVSGDLQALVDR